MGRSDLDVTSGGIDTFIDMAESWFNRNLRVRRMLTSVSTPTLVVSGASVTHPTDWLEWQSFYISSPTPYAQLRIVNDEAAFRDGSGGIAGTPYALIVRASASEIYPTPSNTNSYTGVYYASVPALSVSNTTNWLLTNHPEAYLYGTLLQASGRLGDDPRVPMWQQAFAQVVGEINTASVNAQWGGGTMFPTMRNIV